MNAVFYRELGSFLSIPSVAGNSDANLGAIDFITQRLEALEFSISVEGQSLHGQPFIVARRPSASKESLVLYNHYDVEPVKDIANWDSDPFTMTESQGRFYARGVADNKAVLLARIDVIKARLAAGESVPDILWLIQGEEEVGGALAFDVIPKALTNVKASIFLEETGYSQGGVPLLFYRNEEAEVSDNALLLSSLNNALCRGNAKIEQRTMTKFGKCPFISNLPKGAHYIGFGPNDYQARIHKDNESMDIALLEEYFNSFSRFLNWFNEVYLDRFKCVE